MARDHSAFAPLVAATVLTLGSGCASALDFHGYLRAGGGSTLGKGGGLSCFQLPGTASKYRLGNECEAYGELGADQELFSAKDDKDAVKFVYHGKITFKTSQTQDYEQLKSPNEVALRENWIEAKNLPFAGGGTVWAGKRYYERNDVHITDFYYWDTSGYGVGIQGVKVGVMKFSYALLRNNTLSDNATTRHDIRLGGIPTGGFGDLTVGLQFNRADATDATAGNQKNNGHAITLQHFIGGVGGGFNKIALQYGEGSAANLALAYPDNGSDSSHKAWRLVEQFQWQLTPQFSGMATFVYQDQRDVSKWTSMGVRPVWHFTDYVKLQAELGHDRVRSTGNAPDQRTRTLTKFSIAPTIVAGRGFWARPELRLFYTYAKWNNAARDIAGGVAGGTAGRFGSDTHGSTIGFQAESWW